MANARRCPKSNRPSNNPRGGLAAAPFILEAKELPSGERATLRRDNSTLRLFLTLYIKYLRNFRPIRALF